MEVHHHSHTSRKKWTHYFWEFLMLFLAVFCGFLAEYQWEHTIEHNRERQFITTLVEDLKSDTAQLQSNVNYRKSRERMCDSLIIYLSDHKNKGNDIYFYARNLSRPQYFSPNDRTLQQLKNSGGLRLIRNLRVSDNIMSYDQDLRYLMTLSEDERSIRDGFREIVGTVFDGRILYSQIDTSDIANYTKPADNPPLFMQDAGSKNKTISSTQYLKSVITATILLSFLQKEYNLE